MENIKINNEMSIVKKNIKINMLIEIVEEFENKDISARIYYPNEGNKIQIKKGLNIIELNESIFHEFGHLIDWYISNEKQSKDKNTREKIADNIGEKLNRIKILKKL
jgi:hypothetical protein